MMVFTSKLRASSRYQQRGGALLVSMIMVLLVLMLGVVGMRTVTLESRIGANMLESQRLYEVADGTLREGERTLLTYGVSVKQCDSGTSKPVSDAGVPCYVSDARSDSLGLNTSFTANKAAATGFSSPGGFWYPRYIATECPKGSSATSALEAATVGCTEYHEVNAQATLKTTAQACGPDAFCLRSTINLFIK